MEWNFIIALVLAIPVIFVPVALLWYLNIDSVGAVTQAAHRRRAPHEKGFRVATRDRCLGKGALSAQRSTHEPLEEVHMRTKDHISEILGDSFGRGGTGLAISVLVTMPELDDAGYIVHPEMWTEEIAELLAEELVPGRLTEDHWRVIHYLRDYYHEFECVPPVRKLCRDTGLSLRYIYELFPGNLPRGLGAGLAKCACKIAGIPWMSFKQYP